MPELEEGIRRVIVGPEKKARVMSDKEKRVTAVHEMGHALLAHYLPDADPPHKISIVGRGMALGYVVSLPREDRYTRRKAELMAQLAQALGGRTAEEVVFGEFTTGAENDLQKVTQTAKRMVMKWGMSEALGPRSFGHDMDNPFLGRDFKSEPDYSDGVAEEIDREILRIVEEAHDTARQVLTEHKDELVRLSDVLMEHENMDAEQLERLLAGESPEQVFEVVAEDADAEADADADASGGDADADASGGDDERPATALQPGIGRE
jgi:cell division protease FtsH